MKTKKYIFTCVLFFCQIVFSLNYSPATTQNVVGFSGTGANIDVYYHRANWTIDPNNASKTITGTVTTYFKTTQANVSAINFDLNKTSFNNGSLVVKYHGITCAISFPASGLVNILNITLPVTIPAIGTRDSVVINYSGIPPGVVFAAEGYQQGGSGTNKYIMTLAESYEDRDWWPCKADMQDKIDSAMDLNFTVPWNAATGDTFWVATIGKLVDSSMITGTTRNFSFKTTYPIASYLVAISVAKFTRYYKTVNVSGTNTPVAYYLLRNTAGQAGIVTAMDKINLVLQALSTKFGDYPFKNEKHGFYDGLLGASGMEHQTFSAIATGSLSNLPVLAHELVHQWFGDNVSFSTWNDLWLAEGFANYGEVISAELVPGIGNPYTLRSGFKSSALGFTSTSAWIPNANVVDSHQIWDFNYGSTVYVRGGMVVSMLRALCGDSKFFQALKNYQTNRAGKSATTDTLKNYFNAVLGGDISEFFRDYVGGSGSGTTPVGGLGNPINTVNWNNPAAKKLVLQMGTQGKTAGCNVTYFNGPVVVHATNAAAGWTKDTTIVFYDWGGGILSYAGNGLTAGGNLLSYDLSFTPTNLFYDDSARTMSTGSTNKISTLAVNTLSFFAQKTTTGNKVNLILANNEPIEKVILLKSTNGTDFTQAGLMNKINSNGQDLNYQFNDNNNNAPIIFYRAKIFTYNNVEYSSIIKVQQPVIEKITILPNPANDKVTINFSNANHQKTMVRVLGVDGKVLIESATNNEFIHFEVSNLSSGMYMVQIIQQAQVSQKSQFMLQH